MIEKLLILVMFIMVTTSITGIVKNGPKAKQGIENHLLRGIK